MSEQQWTVTSYDGDYHEVRNEVSGEQQTCDTRLSADKVCTALNALAGIPDPAAALAQAREALETCAGALGFMGECGHAAAASIAEDARQALAALGGAV